MNSVNFIGLPQELHLEILGFVGPRDVTKYRCINRYFCKLIDTHEKILYSEVEVEVKRLYLDCVKYKKQLDTLEKLVLETCSVRLDLYLEIEKKVKSWPLSVVKNTPTHLQPLYMLSDYIMKEVVEHRKLEFKIKRVNEKYKEMDSYRTSFRKNYFDSIEKIEDYLHSATSRKYSQIKQMNRSEEVVVITIWDLSQVYELITKNLSKELKKDLNVELSYFEECSTVVPRL